MCRPALASMDSSGWHLHQSLLDAHTGENAFVSGDEGELLSPCGRQYVAGLLEHARAACLIAAPTINGYKRYRPYSLAPNKIVWARDNRGAMIRVIGGPGDPGTHLENRIRFGWYRPQSRTAPCCRYPVRLQIAPAASKPCGSHNGAAAKCAVSHRVRGCVRRLLADHQRIRGSPLSVGRSDRLGTARVFRTVLKRTLAPCPVAANTLRSCANCSS